MAKPYRMSEAQILAKVEAAPGTAETLATADQFIASNVQFKPSIAFTANSGMTGVHSKEPGVAGVRSGTISFDIALKGSGTAGTAPEWRDCPMACGLSETIVGATSVTYAPAAAESYYTFGWIVPGLGGATEDQLWRLAGCQGNMSLSWKAGEFHMASFSMTGVLQAPTDSSVVAVPTWDTTAPSAFLAPAMLVHTVSLAFETFTMDMGNEVAIRPNANGAAGALTAQITGRRVVGTFDAEMEKLTTFDFFTRMTAGTTGAIAMTPVGAAGNKVDLDLPKVQISSIDIAERAGVAIINAGYAALRSGNAGNDEFSVILT